MDVLPVLLAALCAPGPLGGLGAGPLAGLFLAGLGGGVVHCAPMCGAFVLGQVGHNLARLPVARLCEKHRVSQAMLVPYHLGRLTTYAGLGAVTASLGAGLGLLVWPSGLRAILLALAAVLFLGLALRPWISGFAALNIVPDFLARPFARAVRSFLGLGNINGFLRGVLLGFLPCGLLYATLMIAAATADPLAGATAMVAFGLGTVPALLAVGLAGHAAVRRWGRMVGTISPIMLALNAGLLVLLAWNAA